MGTCFGTRFANIIIVDYDVFRFTRFDLVVISRSKIKKDGLSKRSAFLFQYPAVEVKQNSYPYFILISTPGNLTMDLLTISDRETETPRA